MPFSSAVDRHPVRAVWIVAAVLGLLVSAAGHERFLHSVSEGLSDEYDEIATSLVEHGRYSATPATPERLTVIRGPVYPFYLAGLFKLFGVGNTLAVGLADMLVHATTAAMLAAVLVALAGPVAGLTGGFAYALWPTTFYYAAKGSSETMLNLWLVMTLAAALALRADPRPRHAVWMGAALAMACLTRGSAVTLGVVIVVGFAIAFRPAAALRLLGIAALSWALVMSPWWIRNARVAGTFVPFHTLTWYNAWHDDVYDQRKAWLAARGMTKVEISSVPLSSYPDSVLRHPPGFVYPSALGAREDLAQEKRYREISTARWREPGYLASKIGRNLVDFWSSSSSVAKDRVLLPLSAIWLALYALAWVVGARRRELRGLLQSGFAAVLLSWALYLPFLAIFRHSIPTAPFIAGTLGLAAGRLTRSGRAARQEWS